MPVPHVTVSPANASNWIELVNTDMEEVEPGGRLNGVGVTAGRHEHSVRVTIDGSLSVGDRFSKPQVGYSNNGLNFDLPFSDRLVVEVKDDAPVAYPRFWAAYVTDGSVQVDDSLHVDDGRVYRERVYEHRGGTYRVTALVGSSNVAIVDLDGVEGSPEASTGIVHFRTFDETSEPDDRQRDEESVPRVAEEIGERPGRWVPTAGPDRIEFQVRDPYTHTSMTGAPIELETWRSNGPEGALRVDVPTEVIEPTWWRADSGNDAAEVFPPGLELSTSLEGYENYPDRLWGRPDVR